MQTLPSIGIGIGIGLWISPDGLVIRIGSSHIQEIIGWPSRFGLTSEQVESIYRHFGERVPVEGRARHHIMRAVVFTGWIRLRHQRNYLSVTVDTLEARRATLQSFFHALHQAEGIGRHADIRIYCVQSEQLSILELHELISGLDPAQSPILRVTDTSDASELPPGSAPIDAEMATRLPRSTGETDQN